MASTYDQLIAEITSKYGLANSHNLTANVEIGQAWVDWFVPDDHACLQDVIQCLEQLQAAFVDILDKGFYGWNGSTYALPTALDRAKACPFITEAPPYTLTMADLINSMLVATPYEVNYFVGLVDAYRQAIWNKPFNAEFFAALSRGFMEWE